MVPTEVWHKLVRVKQTGNVGLHSEWDRRLGTCSVASIASILVLAITLHHILPSLFAECTSGRAKGLTLPMLLLSLGLTSALLLLGAHQLAFAAHRIAKNGVLYQLAYCSVGQACAFAVAWSQLADQLCLLAVVCHELSENTDLLFRGALRPTLHVAHPFWPAGQQLDLFATLVVPACGALLMCCSARVLVTACVTLLVAALFTSASTGTVALLHNAAAARNASATHEVRVSDASFLDVQLLFAAARWWLHAWPGALEPLSAALPEECVRSRVLLPRALRVAARAQPALAALALLAFFPLVKDGGADILPLPAMFNSTRLFSARYLMNVGSVCALWGAVLCLFLGPSRLLAAMAQDGLAPRGMAKLAAKGGSPRHAVLCVAACTAALLFCVPRAHLCTLLPLNCTLRLALQALLVYLAAFRPPSSARALVPDYGTGGTGGYCSKYRRVRARLQLHAVEEEDEDDEDEDEEEEFEDESDPEMDQDWWIAPHRQRENLMERVWRLATSTSSCNNISVHAAPAGTAVALQLHAGMPLMALQLHEGTQNTQHHLPRQNCSQHARLLQQQYRHDCLRSPCIATAGDGAFHVYEHDARVGGQTLRVESGTRAARARDAHAAARAAHAALHATLLAAVLGAVAHCALRRAQWHVHAPVLPLLACALALGITFGACVWLRRVRTDDGNVKWMPVGALCSLFALIQLLPLFAWSEWAYWTGWMLIGLLLYARCLIREMGRN